MTDRTHVREIGATGYVGDGAQALHDDGTWKIPAGGGGGGAGSANNDRLWVPGSSETTVDEFRDGSLDSAWVRADAAATASGQTWTEGADVLSAFNAAPAGEGGGKYHALLAPIGAMAAGDAFVTSVTLMSDYGAGYSIIAGLALSNGNTFGSGSQVAVLYFYDQPAGRFVCVMSTMTGFAASSTPLTIGLGSQRRDRIYLRLGMTAANTWRIGASPDGISWITSATSAATLTPTHVAAVTSNASGGKGIASFEFIRRASGVA